MIVRLEKRFSRGTRFLASYTLASYTGTNGPRGPFRLASSFNNNNWFENYGPLLTDRRHVLNLSGFVDLPWRFQASFRVSAYSRPRFLAYVNGVDFNGDGTQEDLLLGSKVNQFMQARPPPVFNQGSPLFGAKYKVVMEAEVGGRREVHLWHPFSVSS